MGDRTQTTQSAVSLPPWMEEAARGVIDRGTIESNRPLTQFRQADGTNSAIAGFNNDQTGAFQMVRDAINSPNGWQMPWSESFGAAMDAGDISQRDAVDPYMQHLDNLNPVAAAQPYLDAASGISQRSAVNPYMQHLDNLNPGAAAQPWLNNIRDTSISGAASPLVQAASASSASNVGEYINPYNEAVTNRLSALAGRNLSENLLPQVNDTFTRAGQFGSDRNADFTARVLRDTQESLLGQQAQVLQSGYQGALGAAATDASRRAGLAGTVGNLAASDVSRLATGAGLEQSSIMNDVSKLGTSANLASSAAAGDRAGALDIARTGQAAIMNDVSKLGTSANLASSAAGADRSGALQRAGVLSNLSGQRQQQSFADADALSRVGGTQQALGQQQLTERQQRFNENRDYGRGALDWFTNIIRGTPQANTTTTTGPGPNWLSQLGGLGLAAYGMTRKDGGRIPFATRGYVDPDYEDEEEDTYGEEDEPDYITGAAASGDMPGIDWGDKLESSLSLTEGAEQQPLMQPLTMRAEPAPMPSWPPGGAPQGKPVDTNTPLGKAQAFLMSQLDGIDKRMSAAADARKRATDALMTPDKADNSLDSRFASPLVQMGLAMAASKSPDLLGGIGEGGLAAAKAASQRQQTTSTQSLTRKKLALDAAKLEESSISDSLKNAGVLARIAGAGAGTGKVQSPLGKLKADLNAGVISLEEYKAGLAKLTQLAQPRREPVDPTSRPMDPLAKLEADYTAGRIPEADYKARKARLTQALPAVIEREEDKGIGKSNAERFTGYQAAGTKSRGALDDLGAMSTLLDQVRDQGVAAPLLKAGSSVLQTFGIDPGVLGLEKAAPAEAAGMLGNSLVMKQMGSLGAGISNADRDFIVTQVPGIYNTKAGNTLIIEILRRTHERAQEVAKIARDYKKGGGDLTYIDDHIAEKLADKPLFDESFRSKVSSLASTAPKIETHTDRLKRYEAEIERRQRVGGP